jgi:hypothetical protein
MKERVARLISGLAVALVILFLLAALYLQQD